MAQQNQIAVAIPAAELQNINTLITQLKTALAPYSIALSAEDRRNIPKMGDKTVAFVDKVKDYAQSHPQLVPTFMNVPDLNVDIAAVQQLNPLVNAIEQILAGVDNSRLLSGSEAYAASTIFYQSVKQAAKNKVADAELIFEDLKKRFPTTSKEAVSSIKQP
jgi:hypothetical protein